MWVDSSEASASAQRQRGTIGKCSRRIDERNGSNKLETQSVHVAPFSHVSRFTRHGLMTLADFFSILQA
jgi:hypothetical protein